VPPPLAPSTDNGVAAVPRFSVAPKGESVRVTFPPFPDLVPDGTSMLCTAPKVIPSAELAIETEPPAPSVTPAATPALIVPLTPCVAGRAAIVKDGKFDPSVIVIVPPSPLRRPPLAARLPLTKTLAFPTAVPAVSVSEPPFATLPNGPNVNKAGATMMLLV